MFPPRLIIAGDFSYSDGGAAFNRLQNVAAAFTGRGYRVQMLAMSGVRRSSVVAKVATRADAKYDVFGWAPADSPRPVAGRLGWFVATYWGTIACKRWLETASGLSSNDVLYLYGRSLVRLAPLMRVARARNAFVLVDSTEGIERFHGFGHRLNPIWWDWKLGINYLTRNADLVAAISTGLAKRAQTKGAKRVCVFPGIEKWSDEPTRTKPNNSVLTLFVFGALSEKDDPRLLLQVVSECSRQKMPVRFMLVGRYAESAAANRWAARIKAAAHGVTEAKLLGAPSSSNLEKLLQTADGYMMLRPDVPAERLAFPTRLVELLKFAKPCIVSDVGDVTCYLKDGIHAYIVAPGEVSSVISKLRLLLQQPEESLQVGRAGFMQGKSCFDRDAAVEKLCAVIAAPPTDRPVPA
jgi:glycosyltransferase involved in cell wall biosynthesis